jgi:AraC-like DNA-binding protein
MEILFYGELGIMMLEGIAKNVVFKSKLSFNNAFKKQTILTPSEFITKFCITAKSLNNEVQ